MSQCNILHNNRWVGLQRDSVYRPTYHRPAHADQWRIHMPQNEHPPPFSTLSPLQSLQRQYVLSCKVSRYCILALHGSCKRTPIQHVQRGYTLSRGR